MGKYILEKLVSISTAIRASTDRNSLHAALDQASALLGFDVFILSSRQTNKRDMVLNSVMTSLPADFLRDYDQFGWFDEDMYLARVLEADTAFFADSGAPDPSKFRKKSYLDFLQANRISTAILAPIISEPDTANFFSMVSFARRPHDEGARLGSMIVADAALGKAEVLGLCEQISADEAIALRSLSAVQHDILRWVAEGKSNGDIATILSIQERNVRYHVGEILRKLGVATRMQAAAICKSGAT